MDVLLLPLDKLLAASYNPRSIKKKDYEDLKKSIERFGMVEPIVVNRQQCGNYTVVGGHQRVQVLKDLGYEEVPCSVVQVTPERERELNIRLNENGGDFDYDILANEFDLADLQEWGFDNLDYDINDEPEEETKEQIADRITLQCEPQDYGKLFELILDMLNNCELKVKVK